MWDWNTVLSHPLFPVLLFFATTIFGVILTAMLQPMASSNQKPTGNRSRLSFHGRRRLSSISPSQG